jgi:hypothetical protein
MARLVSDSTLTSMVDRGQWALRVANNTRIPGNSMYFSSGYYSGDTASPLQLVVQKLATYPYNKVWFQRGSGNLSGWVVGSADDVSALLAMWIDRYGWCPPNPLPDSVCPLPGPIGFIMREVGTGFRVISERTRQPLALDPDGPRWFV